MQPIVVVRKGCGVNSQASIDGSVEVEEVDVGCYDSSTDLY